MRTPLRAARGRALAALLAGAAAAACDGARRPAAIPAEPTPTAPTPPAAPADSAQLLLDDAAMRTPEDPAAPPEDSAWSAWAAANAVPIRSLTSDDFADLRFLEPLLAGKRLVQLGESGHGVAEFDLAKVRLIRFLHQEMGFDVVAFEADLFECHDTDRRAAAGGADAVGLMRTCLYGVWHAREVLPLFEYLRASKGTARPLTLAGVDMKPSTGFVFRRVAFLRQVVGAVDPAYAAEVARTDTTLLLATTPSADAARFVRDSGAAYRARYAALARFLDRNADAIVAAGRGVTAADVLVARQVARNAPAMLGWMDPASRANPRDSAMADNATFLLRELYPGRRIVLWAHNAHVRHGGAPERPPAQSMGAWIAARHRPELYSVGLYMYRGTAAENDRATIYPIAPATSGSVESILYRARRRQSFVDLRAQAEGRGTSWMFRSVGVKEWGRFAGTMVPREQYDAILFVDRTNAPTYIR